MTPQEPIYDDVDGETPQERENERNARRAYWESCVYEYGGY